MKKTALIHSLLLLSLTLNAVYLVDDAETGTTINTLGGTWVTFTDGFSAITFTTNENPAYEGSYCRMFDWTFNAGGEQQYAGAVTSLNISWSGVDLSTFKGLRFFARGYGLYEVAIGTDMTRAENNHYSKKVHIDQAWNAYQLPFEQFAQTWGTPQPWDPTTIFSVTFTVISPVGISGQLSIDNIEFYLDGEDFPVPDPNIKIYEPKVNQIGYLTSGRKYFSVTADSVQEGDEFFILNESNAVVYNGSISGTPVNETESTGEYVWKADISDVNEPGLYTINLNGKGSYPFQISDSVYNPLFRDALRSFYLIRCGIAENDPVTGIIRPACHTALSQIRGSLETMDAVGGWHNAADLGLFVHEISISVAQMLWLYELRPQTFRNLIINTPDSENGVSDLLDEARWGLLWLLKMQKADGTVYHKADGEPNLVGCFPPDQDPYGHIVSSQKDGSPQVPSTIDVADFAGVMSQAARVFTGIDNNFATTCMEAAEKAWTWVNGHPWEGQTDPYYPDPVCWQEYMWAAGEMARNLNSSELRTHFEAMADTAGLTYVGWTTPQLFGYLALYFDPNTADAIKNLIQSKIISAANSYMSVSDDNGYGVAEQWFEYWWESNENVLAKGQVLLIAHEMTGNSAYLDAALSQLNYILGLNSLNKSFVMCHGSNAMQHPYHWIYLNYDKAIPGWLAGGPNCYADGADALLQEVINKETPKAKCYVDIAECGLGAWACNEGETSESAAMIFLSGYLYKGDAPVSLEGSGTPEKIMQIQVFPSPCNVPKGCTAITIMCVPANSLVRIFDTKGELIYTSRSGSQPGNIHWNVMDQNALQGGLYLITITQNNNLIYEGRFTLFK